MDAAPPIVGEHTDCARVVEAMRRACRSSVLIVSDGRIKGIVTERDVVQRVAFRVAVDADVNDIMSTVVHTIRDDDFLYRAIANMRRANLRHMPVVDRDGYVVGMLHLHKALAAVSSRLLDQIDRLTHEETLDGLQHVKVAQVEVAEALFAERVPVPEIQSLLTEINNDIYRRIVVICVRQMSEETWGLPPVRFSIIVMGSGGRGESFLYPDQDNGFILDDYPDEQHAQVDAYFIELAERMTRALDEIGIVYCRGYVMATNPLWRKSLTQWKQQIRHWLRRPNRNILRLTDIFFDFDAVCGRHGLADDLRDYVSNIVKGEHAFLRQMQDVQKNHGVAQGFLGRLTTDQTPGPHKGKLNLKYHGLLPLVESVRLLALREGIAATSTLDRIAMLHDLGVLNHDEEDYLTGAFYYLTRLVLRQQLSDYRAGNEVSAYVPPAALSKREEDMLKDRLHAISVLRERIRTEFTGNIF